MLVVKMNPIVKFIGSGFYTGYIPFASGTWGSLAALLIYWVTPLSTNPYVLLVSAIGVSLIGIPLSDKFERQYGEDPSECTVDEVAGMWLSLLFLPKSFIIAGVTFLIWRIIDILKPFGIKKLEKYPRGYGVMLDDIAGGMLTAIIMHTLLFFNIVST